MAGHKWRILPGKPRSLQLEGSFANEKLHYLLYKIKARTQHTEINWIFFGMLANNAIKNHETTNKSTDQKKQTDHRAQYLKSVNSNLLIELASLKFDTYEAIYSLQPLPVAGLIFEE